MSGGHFDYGQDTIREIADEIQKVIDTNNDTTPDRFGYPRGRQYSPIVISKLYGRLQRCVSHTSTRSESTGSCQMTTARTRSSGVSTTC